MKPTRPVFMPFLSVVCRTGDGARLNPLALSQSEPNERTAMNGEPESTTPELNQILRRLVDDGHLDGTAKGITRLVLSRGEKVLSERQEWVFNTHVRAKYIDRVCELCGDLIPLPEVTAAWGNGGLCATCAMILGKQSEEPPQES
jgi:hypothetical protein